MLLLQIPKSRARAPLGQMDFVVGSDMVISPSPRQPAEYRVTGVRLSTIVSMRATVYQKDLGPVTLSKSSATWFINPEQDVAPHQCTVSGGRFSFHGFRLNFARRAKEKLEMQKFYISCGVTYSWR